MNIFIYLLQLAVILITKKCIKLNKGLTLIEIIVAAAIMGTVFIALISMFSVSTKVNINTKNRNDMAVIAQALMERALKQEGYGVLSTQIGTNPVGLDAYYSAKYDAERTISQVRTELIKVTIRVKEKSMTNYSNGTELTTQVWNKH